MCWPRYDLLVKMRRPSMGIWDDIVPHVLLVLSIHKQIQSGQFFMLRPGIVTQTAIYRIHRASYSSTGSYIPRARLPYVLFFHSTQSDGRLSR